ncbi:MAG: hypothetical protein ACP5N3_04340 [Candidatus Nanoarchaeia archaeon]
MVKKADAKKVITIKAKKMDCCDADACGCHKTYSGCGTCGAIYGLGFIGAVIYYLITATGFWNGVLGVLKSIVWPVFLVFGLLKFIGA